MNKQLPPFHASASPAYAPPLRRTALALLIATCFGTAHANPALPQVVNGQATFNQQGNVFSITNTPNTIINWQSFSIHAGEITRFIQENSNSAVLNRITGQDPSKILGTLESNGKVFLINPNGIVFGQGARVDVQGLVASSLGMSNEDFLAGKRQFTAGTVAGAVSNAGAIQAAKGGQVLLIAPNVENTGIITAPNGDVILAAGRSVQLADAGNPDLRVLVSAPADQALNLGSIIARGGSIGMAGALVSQRGVLNADSAVVGENGKIVLKASGQSVLSAGSVTTATGAGKGGEIQVLGDQVGLFGDARVDASGQQGGGTVLLGGDYQGKNSAVQNARQVVVGKDASIAADAIGQGNGGKVIVWGDESTRMHGSISARGGAAGGNGGFVETSGHYLAVDGATVDTRARSAQGKTGDWLLDPYDINVVAGNGGSLGSVDEFGDLPVTGATTIGADQISNASSNVVLQAQNDININAAIAITQANVGFKAQAGNSINVNNAISTNGGALVLSANDNGGSTAQGSSAVLNLNAAVASQGGNVSLTGADIIFGAAGSVNLGAGNATLHANKFDGKINLNGSGGQITGTGAAGQTVSLQADNMNLQGGVALGGAAGGGAVSLSAESAGRQISLGSKTAGKLSLSGADLNAVSAGTLTIGNASMTGAIGVDQAVTVASGATGPGTLVLQTAGGVAIANALSVAGNLSVNTSGAVSAAGAVTVGGTFNLVKGNWSQNAASLPAFSASNFVIGTGTGTSFLRTTGGTGSSGNPYLISDIYGLQGIASLDLGNSYRLVNNIDASGTANWNGTSGFVPIAGGSGRYSGIFDGGGFAISNLKIDGGAGATWPTGLFGTLHGGTLRNLALNGGSVAGAANVGALVGNVMGGSTIDNVSSSAAVSGQSNVGGLAGTNAGTITRSGSSGSVTGVNVSGAGAIGGLVGQNTSEGRISTSYATGTVTGAREMVGGLIGNNLGVLAQSYATGNVSGGRNIGGLVGSNGGGIDDSYATGAVGGAANADPGLAKENIGGLIGESTGRVSHVFSSGQVNGAGYANVGAVAGRVANGSPFGYSFFNYETSGVQTDAGGSTGRSTAQMMQGGSFNDFDFSSVWRIYDGYTTPMLKAFLKPLTVTVSGNTTSKVYDGQLASFDGALAYLGLLDGDTAANGALAYQSARNVGSYGLTGLWSTKYDITVAGTTSLTITPRVLTVSVGGSKVYDGLLGFDQANFTLGNVVVGDNIGVSGSAVFLDKNAGTGKAVHVSGLSLEDNALGNYSLAATTFDGTADIVARTLNLNFTGINKTYDGTTSAGVIIGDDRIAGDALTVAGSASFADKNAGTGKTISVNGVGVTGADAGNYVLGSHSGSTT
ncbi:beta strand repeat-containing protein, partial [Janthinobacterium sp. Mn2066]|uniref:beta strand repeat-containing protein n=1 Tax=Janthinobacterium sp. Mn2066 TaxID=3395264 RepID=UPI003BC5CDD5